MKLIIVESPNKCHTISRYLGDGYKVMASAGHIRDLAKTGKGGLGIDVENGFVPKYVINPTSKETVSALQKAAKKADEVILATDPDREGEAISWHLSQVLGLDEKKVKRLQFHEITKPAVEEAIENPGLINLDIVNAQETRRMQDRIIGFKLSDLLKKSETKAESAGRVQSATLKMVVDNDREVKAFVPEEYWTIETVVDVNGVALTLSLEKVDGENPDIHNEEEALKIVARIPDVLPLTSLTEKVKAVPSRLPLTTSTMQQEASSKYKFSTSKTQRLAQELFEGLDVGGDHVGLITYIRTDSTRISENFYEKHAKPFILETFGNEYLGKPKKAKAKGKIQDAHEAIRPTGTHRTPELVAKYLKSDQAKLYRLIYNRAMASLMSDKKVAITTAIFEANGLTFKATGSRTLFPGFAKLYALDEEADTELPALKQGESLNVLARKKEQKYTKGPSRFTEAKLVKTMEENGVGRPSTYAATIKKIQDRKYVVLENGHLVPTETGIKATETLEHYFPEFASTEYTAKMERQLDDIEEGRASLLETMDSFYGPFIGKLGEAKEHMLKEMGGGTCPECGGQIIGKTGRYGAYRQCEKCGYKPPKEGVKEIGRSCPRCGLPLVERKYKGGTFVGCSGYSKNGCTYTEFPEGQKPETKRKTYTEADFVKECPRCKTGHLVVRGGKRKFLGCTNYPKCRHIEKLPESINGRDKEE